MIQEKLASAKNLFFIALTIDVAVTVFIVITDFWAVNVLNDIRAGVTKADQSTISSLVFWGSFYKVWILTLIGVGLALVRWLGACYDYAKEALEATGFAQERWKTWGWIVPVMNVFKPYQVLTEIYRAGATDYLGGEEWKKSSGSRMLLGWWIFWVITHMVIWGIAKQAINFSLTDATLSQIIDMHYASIIVCVISLSLAGLWFVVAGSLTRRLLNHSVPVVGFVASAQFPAANEAAASIARNFTNNLSSENPSQSPLQTAVDEERVYTEIAKELETSIADKGLWTRLFAECGGDEKQTKVLYIRARADRLISTERSRLEQAAHAHAAESVRLEKLRLQRLPVGVEASPVVEKSSTKPITAVQKQRFERPLSGQSAKSQVKRIFVWIIGLSLVYGVLFAVFGSDWKDFSAGLFATTTNSITATIFGHVFTANLLTCVVWFGLKIIPSFASTWPFRSVLPSSVALGSLIVISGLQWALTFLFWASHA